MGSALPVRVFVEMNTPPELTAHTNKRVTMKSGTEEVKSKLDFSSCSLDDNHVSFPQRALTLLSIFLAPYFR
jgi:hypothetical protein